MSVNEKLYEITELNIEKALDKIIDKHTPKTIKIKILQMGSPSSNLPFIFKDKPYQNVNLSKVTDENGECYIENVSNGEYQLTLSNFNILACNNVELSSWEVVDIVVDGNHKDFIINLSQEI